MTRLSIEALCVIDAIARKGSFAAAAEELFRVPSAITYTVQKLERDLEIQIFDRSGHRAILTPAGRRLLEQGRHILRAVGDLESDIKRIATGWEAELRIAVDDLIDHSWLLPIIDEFFRLDTGTRLRLVTEVFGGTWDAVESGRADLAVGAAGDPPPSSGFSTRTLGSIPFVFVVAPQHPLAAMEQPLTPEAILQHRALAVADSSRNLPPRTAALLSGQDVLTLPTMVMKVEAHRRGWGVGSVPRYLVEKDLREGTLVAREVENQVPDPSVALAWRTNTQGKAFSWFQERLADTSLYPCLCWSS